jgi:hypothetical protein
MKRQIKEKKDALPEEVDYDLKFEKYAPKEHISEIMEMIIQYF